MFGLKKKFKAHKHVQLTEQEKSQSKDALLSFMDEYGDVRESASGRHIQQRSLASYFTKLTLRPMPLALLAVLLMGVGT